MSGKTNTAQETVIESQAKDGEVDQDFLERFAEGTGWKAVLLYQYLSGYIVMIAVSAIAATAIAWLELTHAIITPVLPREEVDSRNYFEIVLYLMDFLYSIDIVFRVLYTLTHWPNMKLYNEPVAIEFIVVDIVSVIPYDVLYSAVADSLLIIAILRLRVMIRLYRVGTSLSLLTKMFHEVSIGVTLIWSISLMMLCMLVPSSIHYILYCDTTECSYRNYSTFMPAYLTATRFLLTNGPDLDVYLAINSIYHMYSMFAICYFIGTMYIIGDLACKNINHIMPIYCFIHDYQTTMQLYHYFEHIYRGTWSFEDQQTYFTLKDYYYHFLRERNGISALGVLHKILPPGMTKNVITDMSYDSFKHSHLFRTLDMCVIRFLSTLVRFEFAVPGQVIVRKGDYFNKMLYISHGVLQILSHEDGETPVLNLSGGTSLGETTLFISYRVNCTIICQTYCELVVIDKEMIKKMAVYYPNEYRGLVQEVMTRYENARRLKRVVLTRMEEHLIKSDLLNMSWIKQFQRCFLHDTSSDDGYLANKIRGLQYYIENLIFYIGYLDKLVVSEEIELVKDSVFLKSTYHFILQPKSPILIVWNTLLLLMTVLFILVYPYNLCYPSENCNIQTVLCMFVTLLYWLDIYLQIFTAVKTRGATYLTFRSILVYRLRQKEFLVDCFAALPLEYFVIFLTGQTSDIFFMFMQFNRLTKYYKLVCFFNNINIWRTDILTFFHYFKYIMHFVFFYYYATMLIYIFNCYEDVCTPEFQAMLDKLDAKYGIRKIIAVTPLSNSIITGVIIGQMPVTSNAYVYVGYTLMSILSYLLKALFLVNVISCSALQNFILLRQQEYLLGILEALEWFEVTKSYRNGIRAYLNTLFYFKLELFEHYNVMDLPPDLAVSFRNIHLNRLLTRNPLFKFISKDQISFLSPSLKVVIIPANIVVFNCGQAIDEFYIIQQGYCAMWYGNMKTEVTINENLGLVEVLLDIPIYHTIITITDCLLVKVSKADLQNYFSNYVHDKRLVYYSLHEFVKCHSYLSRKEPQRHEDFQDYAKKHLLFRDYADKTDSQNLSKFARFKQRFKHAKFKYQFKTISATSRYLLIWEIVKNSALLISLTYTGIVTNIHSPADFYVLLFLDCFNFADILVRFLVTYFDAEGFEIKKIRKTVIYYLTHAFIIDFIGSFPIDLCVPNAALVFTRLNRYILGYRVIRLGYFLTKRIEKVGHFVFVTYLIMVLMLTQNLANYYINVECVRSGDSITCAKESWYDLSVEEINRNTIQFESLLYLLSILSGVGFQRYNNLNLNQRFLLSLWGIAGHVSAIIIVGRAVAYNLFRKADLTTYQDAMRNLVRFLSYCNIDKSIKNEVIQHFEYIWEKRQGKDIADIVEDFPTSVKKDLLLNIYGKYFRQHSGVFHKADDNFLKSLLMIAKQQTFRKTGVLYKIDDIHGHIFFLLKGSVEAVGPDLNRLCTLPSGSLFGCLDNCKQTRQTLTMVAKGHVETLCFTSADFYDLLRKHPKFRAKFYEMSNLHFDFIPALEKSKVSISTEITNDSRTALQMNRILNKLQTKIWKPNKYILAGELLLYIFEFVIGTAYELFLMTIRPNLVFYLLAYARDSCWMMRMYLKFHIAYEDDYGMLQFNRSKIARRYVRLRDGFYFDLVCILPLDLFAFMMSDPFWFNNVFFVLRLNRFLRSYYLLRHMSLKTKKLNINVLLMRTTYIILYVYIYVEIKLIIYFWSETLLMKDPSMTNVQLTQESLIYVDTILFMFISAPDPYIDYFNGWASFSLIFILCMDICFLAFFVSNFTSTLQVVTKVKTKYLTICRNLKLLMLICDASMPLVEKIERYTNILLRVRNGAQFPFLLEHAPYYLREAVMNSMFGFHLRNHYLFKDCHMDFLRQLSATMRTLTYFEGNQVCDAGDIDETMYFIQEGVVQALSRDALYTETCEHVLVAGESFGLNQILYPTCGQYYTYRATMLTTLVTLQRADFVQLVAFFPSVEKHIFNRSVEFAS